MKFEIDIKENRVDEILKLYGLNRHDMTNEKIKYCLTIFSNVAIIERIAYFYDIGVLTNG